MNEPSTDAASGRNNSRWILITGIYLSYDADLRRLVLRGYGQ